MDVHGTKLAMFIARDLSEVFWFVFRSCDFVDRADLLDKCTIHEATRTEHEN